MIVNGLFIGGAVLLGALCIFGVWLWLRREDLREDPFAHTGLSVHPAEGFAGWEMPPEIAHDEYAPAQRFHAAPPAPAAVVEQTSPKATLPPPPATHVPGSARPGTAPGPGRLPEGDTHTLWPPQEAPGPGGPLEAARAAMDAVKDMPIDGYLGHLEQATTYTEPGPFTNWLSADTIARGIPAIRLDGNPEGDGDGDMDAPLSRPLEVFHETEAGV